jgi:F-type H+-transporting ATPase subunit b
MEALGIDLRWFLFQFGNFIVLFVLLSVILNKPLRKLLEDREHEIKEGLENADRMKVALAETEERQRKTLEEAQREAQKMLDAVKAEGKLTEEKLRLEAQEKAEKLLTRAQEDIASERDKLRKELRGELASMVIQATEKVLDEGIDSKTKKDQVEKLVKDLEN